MKKIVLMILVMLVMMLLFAGSISGVASGPSSACVTIFAIAYTQVYDACESHDLPVDCHALAWDYAEGEFINCMNGGSSPHSPSNWG